MISSNVVDILILVIFLASIIIGFGRGFVSEVVSLITVIAGITLGIMFTEPLAEWFTNTSVVKNVVTDSTAAIGANTAQPVSYMAIAISFTLIFVGVILLGAILKALLNVAFRTGMLGIGNRILGGVFGFVRAYLLTIVFIFVVELTTFDEHAVWTQSRYVPYFQPTVVLLGEMVSPALTDFKDKVTTTVKSLGMMM